MVMFCPYCDIEINEKQIEAEDGCCPECGARTASAMTMIWAPLMISTISVTISGTTRISDFASLNISGIRRMGLASAWVPLLFILAFSRNPFFSGRSGVSVRLYRFSIAAFRIFSSRVLSKENQDCVSGSSVIPQLDYSNSWCLKNRR